jgi:myosin-6
VLPPALAQLDPRTFAKALFKALGLNEDDFQFGVSKVFFRPGKFAEFDTIMKSDPANLAALVGKVMVWLVKQRWKKVAWACVSCLKFASKIRARAEAAIAIQKTILMYMARKTHKPRYQGIQRLNQLREQLATLGEVVEKLEKNKDKFQKIVAEVSEELNGVINQIKSSETLTRDEINARAADVEAKMGKQLEAIKKEQEKQKARPSEASLEPAPPIRPLPAEQPRFNQPLDGTPDPEPVQPEPVQPQPVSPEPLPLPEPPGQAPDPLTP